MNNSVFVESDQNEFQYLLSYSMLRSPSLEANWFAASQDIPLILWNPKVHYRTHKRPPRMYYDTKGNYIFL